MGPGNPLGHRRRTLTAPRPALRLFLEEGFDKATMRRIAGAAGLTRPGREKLPELLRLYKMGVILFWLCDDSPGQAKTAKTGW